MITNSTADNTAAEAIMTTAPAERDPEEMKIVDIAAGL